MAHPVLLIVLLALVLGGYGILCFLFGELVLGEIHAAQPEAIEPNERELR